MAPRLTLQKLADNLIRESKAPFNAEDFAEKIQRQWSRKISDSTLKRLKRRLSAHDYLIGIRPNDFLPYKVVFDRIRDLSLGITLGKFEMSRKVLIPGHRIIPFISNHIDEADLIFLDPRGDPVPKSKKSFLIEDVTYFYQYAAGRHFPRDIKVNEWILGKSSLSITVWDLEKFLKDTKSRAGDAILIRLVDFDKGIFQLDHSPRQQLRKHYLKIRSINVALEMGIARLCEDKAFLTLALQKQLLMVLFGLEKELLGVPAFFLTDFMELLQELTFMGAGEGGIKLVPVGHGQPGRCVWTEAPRIPRGDDGSLKEIFKDLGLAFDESEFKSILYTVMASDYYNVEKVFNLLFGGEGKLFHNKKQHDVFYKFLRKLLQGICEDLKKPESRMISNLRRQTVGIKLSLIGILRFLERSGVGLQDVPEEILSQIEDLDYFCAQTLARLADREAPTDIKFVQEVRLALKIILPHLASLEEDVYDRLGIY